MNNKNKIKMSFTRITFSRKSFRNFGETWKRRKKKTMILLVNAKRLHLRSKLKQKIKVASKHKELEGVGLESPFNYLEVTTECGKYPFELSKGTPSPKDLKNHKVKLPWVAYVVEKMPDGKFYPICLASIIPDASDEGSTVLMTLNQCINKEKFENGMLYIYVGNTLPVTDKDDEDLYEIELYTIDKNAPNPLLANVAIVQIKDGIEYDNEKKAVCLPYSNAELQDKTLCAFSALKYSAANKTFEEYLIEALYDADTCQATKLTLKVERYTELCFMDFRKDVYLAKGGPLICNINGLWTQMGIHAEGQYSFDDYKLDVSDKVVQNPQPATYVKVSRFRSIMQNSQNLESIGRLHMSRNR
ncbi:Tissue-type plasminogen activator [Trichinella pseudospiralis]|uniref:Tissue-type plasminogen activator n=1 Tax=Trichinella pseudospiralis TaxID=6337 RepID=A0A0V1EDB0_TRIPS|nr:Tissue-type plasminogen activator [Trichinella pseudospiralis]